MPAPSLDIISPEIVVVASGDTASTQANARGHLFERFVAKLFEAYGCEKPSKSSLNVRSNGYEVDIVTRFVLSNQRAIAECKAYSSALPSSDLNAFYGKLSAERLDEPETHGWFVAIPGLTAEGFALAKKLEAKDHRFRLITSEHIFRFAREKAWIDPINLPTNALVSDEAILVTETGLCSLAKQLDSNTRLPVCVLVQRPQGEMSEDDLALVGATNFAAGLPVHDCAVPTAVKPTEIIQEPPTLVTVVGSSGDFEYQFPAAPAFFIGRENVLETIDDIVREGNASGRVLVLNAQSGWGKSSLALRIAADVKAMGGFASVFDTRTATIPQYVSAALRESIAGAMDIGLLTTSANASFASISSALKTLQAATWNSPASLLIFFDQFENVFRDPRLTQEFRDLALAIREVEHPVLVGFSWKTDLVGFTEKYPYRLRDEIRGAATVINVEPFGPREVGTLLGRLAKAAGTSISTDLKQRLREYSQGLPWLLKKLASHILTQLQAGTLEEVLLSESLNIERLFQQDLASLEAPEIEALKIIAREAPVPVSDIVERIDSAVIQSLVDQRLLVRVGERLDVYWDVFREFLITEKVAVEDTYILRQRPTGITAKMLQLIVRSGGEISTSDAVHELGTSENVVFNAARELRQLGILAPRSGSSVLVEPLRSGPVTEASLRERVARALRRHRVFRTVQELLGGSPAPVVTIDDLAKELPNLFPAIAAKATTWRVYSLAFSSWLDYSGLFQLRGQMLCDASATSKLRLLGGGEQGRQKTFPQGRPEPAFMFLRGRFGVEPAPRLNKHSEAKAINDLQVLGVLDESGAIQNAAAADLVSEKMFAGTLRPLLDRIPGGSDALRLLESEPRARPEQVGSILRDAYGLPWVDSTTKVAGSKFRAWAQMSGVKLAAVKRKRNSSDLQGELLPG